MESKLIGIGTGSEVKNSQQFGNSLSNLPTSFILHATESLCHTICKATSDVNYTSY